MVAIASTLTQFYRIIFSRKSARVPLSLAGAAGIGARFIQVRNRSIYLPQEKNPKGETHEDVGFLSFDSSRKRIVFRQFHSEGFVNQYVLESNSTPGRLIFTTEAIENIPSGFRARETSVLTGSDQFEEVFEIAEPGKEFEIYSRSRLTRAR